MPWPHLTFVPAAKERAGLTERERRYADDNDLKFWTNFALLTAVLAGVLVAVCHRGTITASITAFAGALGLGGVLGFLFGVPSPTSTGGSDNVETATITTGDQSIVKVGSFETPPPAGAVPAPAPVVPPKPEAQAQALQPPAVIAPLNNAPNPANAAPPKTEMAASATPKAASPAQPKAVTTKSAPPSNLEQVADWVTKLLLGGGLTQISKIPGKVWQWSYAVAISISGNDASPAAPALIASNQAFAAGLMVYGFILGFFAGFLITKIQLGKAISS